MITLPRYRRVLGGALCAVLIASTGSLAVTIAAERAGRHLPATSPNHASQLPVLYEVNEGQFAPDVRFASRRPGSSLVLRDAGADLILSPPAGAGAELHLRAVGANPAPQVVGIDRAATMSNYLIGNDPSAWRSGVANYSRVTYKGLYPGVDAVFHGDHDFEYDFIVAPGADERSIALSFGGATSMALAGGELVLGTPAGEVRQRAPHLYQQSGSTRIVVDGGYVIDEVQHQVRFHVGVHDPDLPLVIDPVLAYTTTMGGTRLDQAAAVAVDGAGSAYVTGQTQSNNFPTRSSSSPTTPAFQPANGQPACGSGAGVSDLCTDAFVVKLGPDGSVAYSTYLGGGVADSGRGIAVDSGGNAYVTGKTASPNFPTVQPIQSCLTGVNGSPRTDCKDAFVSKLSPDGAALLFSTYLGGSSLDDGYAIAADDAGNAIVTGETASTDFPAVGGYQNAATTGLNGYVTKISTGSPAIVYSSYLGGASTDSPRGVALSAAGRAYVVGYTNSTDFPVRAAVQPTERGSSDAFITALDPSMTGDSSLVFSTYLGGTGTEEGDAVAVDGDGNAYVTGYSDSADFPVNNPVQPAKAGGRDAFISKLSPSGSTLLFGTLLGGTGDDIGQGIAVDSNQNAYVTGDTRSSNFPIRAPLLAHPPGVPSAFATKVDTAAHAIAYSTYVPLRRENGSAQIGFGIAVDSSGNAYVAGSAGVPFANGIDVFVDKLGPGFKGGHVDFDQDLSTDISLFRPSSGSWLLHPSSGAPDAATVFGGPGDTPVAADYDGDGTADLAFFRRRNGQWTVRPSSGGPDVVVMLGAPGDLPVPADYDGDGKADVAVYRPSTGLWNVHRSSDNTEVTTIFGGAPGDVPVPNDFDGDKKADFTVFRSGTWRIHKTTDGADRLVNWGQAGDIPFTTSSYRFRFGDQSLPDFAYYRPSDQTWGFDSWYGSEEIVAFGAPGDIPVPGDYDGDTTTDVAMFRPSTATWLIHKTVTDTDVSTSFGTPTDIPLPLPPAIWTLFFAPPLPLVDFDGDARTDISVFRPSGGAWFSHPSTGPPDTAVSYGAPGDVPITGDFDGDAKTDVAIFRPSTGLWAIHPSGGGADTFVTYGIGTDVPVPADYDGDGKTDIALYRPSLGTWFVHRSSDGADAAFTFGGIGGDVPVPADFDGDGTDDLAIFRGGTWYVHPSGGGADSAVNWGTAGDIPLLTRFFDAHTVDVTIFRPSTGLWASRAADGRELAVTYGGIAGDVPVAADYDGDGLSDIAVFRPSFGAWFVRQSSTGADTVTTFGINTDIPLQLPLATRLTFFP